MSRRALLFALGGALGAIASSGVGACVPCGRAVDAVIYEGQYTVAAIEMEPDGTGPAGPMEPGEAERESMVVVIDAERVFVQYDVPSTGERESLTYLRGR